MSKDIIERLNAALASSSQACAKLMENNAALRAEVALYKEELRIACSDEGESALEKENTALKLERDEFYRPSPHQRIVYEIKQENTALTKALLAATQFIDSVEKQSCDERFTNDCTPCNAKAVRHEIEALLKAFSGGKA